MADERAIAAIERIEQALARIVTASEQMPSRADDDGELIELRETHQALRSRVEGAIAQIDRLLASNGAA